MSAKVSTLPMRPAALALLFAAAALAGCADRHNIEVGAVPDDYRTRHPIVVTEAERELEILVASSETSLTLADQTRVEDFARRFRTAKGSVMRVLVPAGTRNEAAASAVARSAEKVLVRHGVPRERIIVSRYQIPGWTGEAAPLRLSYNGIVAQVAPCGRWPEDLGNTHENRNYFNFGCASQNNLAAQIADPRDLLGPRGPSEIDAERRTTVIDNYRRGRPTGAQTPAVESDYQW